MAKYLISTTEFYRADTEEEAQNLIQKNKDISYGDLIKYSNTYKEIKSKGVVIDSYYKVVLTKTFDSERDPLGGVDVSYHRAGENY